jgi:hypothetical protein
MLSRFTIFFLVYVLSSGISSSAQIPDGILLLKSDTLFQLSHQSNGNLRFIPVFKKPVLDSIGALSFYEKDACLYGINYHNAHFIKIYQDGGSEDLGLPIDGESNPLPNDDLTSAVVVGNEMFVLAYSTNSIYAVDLTSKPLRFKVIVNNIGFSLPNTLAYNPLTDKLYILDQNYAPISINPRNGVLELPKKNSGFQNFPKRQLLSYGKLWFDKSGRCFLLSGIEGLLYELDTENRIAYSISKTGFNSPKDAVFTGQEMPHFLNREILNLKVQNNPFNPSNVEIEWYENNGMAPVFNYYTERLNPTTKSWEVINVVPGYAQNQQSNRYLTLDRNPFAESCYRLKIEKNIGSFSFSELVCLNKYSTKNLWLSKSVVDWDELENELRLIKFNGRIDIYATHLVTEEKNLISSENVYSDDQSITFKIPQRTGPYEIIIWNDGQFFTKFMFVK